MEHYYHLILRPLPSDLLPLPFAIRPDRKLLYQHESSCKTVHMEMYSAYLLIFMQIKLIFI